MCKFRRLQSCIWARCPFSPYLFCPSSPPPSPSPFSDFRQCSSEDSFVGMGLFKGMCPPWGPWLLGLRGISEAAQPFPKLGGWGSSKNQWELDAKCLTDSRFGVPPTGEMRIRQIAGLQRGKTAGACWPYCGQEGSPIW